MVFPYHLSDFVVYGMRITPFQYYVGMIQDLLEKEKNYDILPNFTAADVLRILGIGRNQYIELMNQCRSRSFLGIMRKPIRELLPKRPVRDIVIEYWWKVFPGYITEDDVRYMVSAPEKAVIDAIIADDSNISGGGLKAGEFNERDVRSLYLKGLIYLDVPIEEHDLIVVPPLRCFVMNRVQGDYFETLLYKIFVSIDEKTLVSELASILQIDLTLIKNAISMFCRLGIAYKKHYDISIDQCHSSWQVKHIGGRSSNRRASSSSQHLTDCDSVGSVSDADGSKSPESISKHAVLNHTDSVVRNKRLAFFYDSTLVAFLMMGNLSPGLKTHAVTMFEVGKLPDECIDSLLFELSDIHNINVEEEGDEAERYFLNAIMLYRTVQFLRHNPSLTGKLITDESDERGSLGLDLIRCDSLMNLDSETCERLLRKNYAALLSVTPLSNESRLISNISLPFFGPCCPLINSVWFHLYVYTEIGFGPPSLLLTKNQQLKSLPDVFRGFDTLYLTPWSRDAAKVSIENALAAINDISISSPVLVQGYVKKSDFTSDDLVYVPFPLSCSTEDDESKVPFEDHPAIVKLSQTFHLDTTCGFTTLIRHPLFFYYQRQGSLDENDNAGSNSDEYDYWTLLDCHFGIPLFDRALNKSVCNKLLKYNLLDPEK